MPEANRFVVVHNGRRDDYQVALALHQAGMLDRLVTDFYGTSRFQTVRYCEGLPSAVVSRNGRALGAQLRLHFSSGRSRRVDWQSVHHSLGTSATRIANRNQSGVLAYSGGTAEYAFQNHTGGPRVLFLFHPLPQAERDALQADRELCRQNDLILTSERLPSTHDQAVHDRELASADLVITTSAFTREGAIRRARQLGVSPRFAAPVPYGSSAGLPSERHHTNETRFLFVGQGIQRKGLHHLLLVWRRLALPPNSARLTIVAGRADPEIMRLASGTSGVTILGRLTRQELDRVFDTSDVLVLPSLVEGFGLVIPEALGHGLHVIATSNTGLPDLSPPVAAGQIVPPGDLQALESAMLSAMDRRRRSPEASLAVAQQFSWGRFRLGIVEALSPHQNGRQEISGSSGDDK